MKIELIVPDDMFCGFINCVCGDRSGLMLRTHQISTDEIKSGQVIIPSEEG